MFLPRNHTKKATYIAFFFEPKLDFCHVRIYFDLQLDKDDFSLKRQPTLPFCHLITPKRQLPLPFWIKTRFFVVRNLLISRSKNMIFLAECNLHCLFPRNHTKKATYIRGPLHQTKECIMHSRCVRGRCRGGKSAFWSKPPHPFGP